MIYDIPTLPIPDNSFLDYVHATIKTSSPSLGTIIIHSSEIRRIFSIQFKSLKTNITNINYRKTTENLYKKLQK